MSKQWEERQVSLGGAIIGGVVTLVIGLAVGLNWTSLSAFLLPFFGYRTTTASANWSALDEVYSALVANYDGEIDHSLLIEGAKHGLVEAIGDIYTVYMSADEAEAYQAALHGEVGAGVGIEMALRDGYVRVLRTLPDNPAREAGVLAGDIIYKINDEEVYAETTEAIANKLKGEPGTEVTLTVVRDGEEKSFTLTRETINNVSAYVDYRDHTAIITVTRFDDDTGTKIQQIVRDEFPDRDIQKVILDLRNNGGGYVSAAQDLLSLWLDGDEILVQSGKTSGDTTTYANRNQALLADTPTIVLVNGATASASEIVAGALQDYQKATLLGETTYGKGVVQTLLNLSGGTLLKVTTARWYTPLGTSINGQGITPNVTVELTYDDTNHGRDPQLDAALELEL